jgi:hypothetical protein
VIEILFLKLAKFVAILLLGGATAGALREGSLESRQRAAYVVGVPAFLLVGTAGYGLTRLTGVSLGAPWIAGTLLLSLVWLALLFRAVEADSRRTPLVRGLAWSTLVGALALMIFRPGVTP